MPSRGGQQSAVRRERHALNDVGMPVEGSFFDLGVLLFDLVQIATNTPNRGCTLRPIGPCSSILFHALIGRACSERPAAAFETLRRERAPRADGESDNAGTAGRTGRLEYQNRPKDRSRTTKHPSHHPAPNSRLVKLSVATAVRLDPDLFGERLPFRQCLLREIQCDRSLKIVKLFTECVR